MNLDYVAVEQITMNYQSPQGETQAISNVSFTVKEGDFVCIVGPSGCGKSTLLSIICGLIKPSGGKIYIKGELLENSQASIGYMLQKDHLFEWRSIRNNALLGLEIQNRLTEENIQYADALLDKYGLKDFKKSKPSELSGGMRQRAALIRTLATKPDLLLLDEPFSALDYQTRLYVADEIGTIIKNEKKTVIMVTHDISEAISLSDKVIVLSKRPSTVKSVYDIQLTMDNRTAMNSRDALEFKDYFNKIWKELDIHGS